MNDNTWIYKSVCLVYCKYSIKSIYTYIFIILVLNCVRLVLYDICVILGGV